MQPKLKKLVDKGLLWQGRPSSGKQQEYLHSGSDVLDKQLGGGWQLDGLHECQRQNEFTEYRLIKPLLQQALVRQVPVFWINPPALVSAAGLSWQLAEPSLQIIVQAQQQNAAWAFEQVLKSGTGIALFWGSQEDIDANKVRRWYKAAQSGHQPGFVFTGIQSQPEARSYTNRIALQHGGVEVDIVKRRYGWPVQKISL